MGEPNFEEADQRGAGIATPTPSSTSAGAKNVHPQQQDSPTSTAEVADANAGATAAVAKDTNVAGFQHPAVPGSRIGSGSGSHSYGSQGEGAQGSDTQCNSTAALATNTASYMQNAQLPPLNTTSTALPLHQGSPATAGATASATGERHQSHHPRTPSSAGLSLDTNFTRLPPSLNPLSPPTPSIIESKVESRSRSNTIPHQTSGGGSLKTVLSTSSMASSLSPGSAISSPALGALQDITPLPSPLVGGDSPGPWGRRASIVEAARPHSRHSSIDTPTHSMFPHHAPGGSGAGSPARTKKKGYGGLISAAVSAQAASTQTPEKAAGAGHERSHSRNRSISEFVPEALHNVRPRHVTISNVVSQAPAAERVESEPLPSIDTKHLHREEYLAEQRGLTPASASAPSLPTLTPTSVLPATLPTPPASNQSAADSDDDLPLEPSKLDPNAPNIEYLPVRSSPSNPPKLWRPVRLLGQGTFSKVILATSQRLRAPDPLDEATLDPHKLVAIKVVEHGPAGGADEERIELSLKREVEMLKSVLHPSLIHLKAFDYNDQHALLVLTYCPGGDLFDLASEHRDLLTPSMVQRIFAELVGAVRYLHKELIVHRDIKLENALLNVRPSTLTTIPQPQQHAQPLITLTDLGLSRRIPPSPASPLLTTRCGSEDYAAPEILLGQPYDGRLTDAWALGVLLYALMEGRLPFDAPPGKAASRSRASHRIARCEWIWVRFGDTDGEWDNSAPGATAWHGARDVVQGLLKKVSRGRTKLDDVEMSEYVQYGIVVEGGLQMRQENYDEDDGIVKENATEEKEKQAAQQAGEDKVLLGAESDEDED